MYSLCQDFKETECTENSAHQVIVGSVACTVCLCFVAQLCLALCEPVDIAGQGPLSVGILQARIMEWVATHA